MAVILFSLEQHPLTESLCLKVGAIQGGCEYRRFPDGESYLRVLTPVDGQHCIILCNMLNPDEKYLPFIFLADTLRELGALTVGLVSPYLGYMRQDIRFKEGEVVTSRIFAKAVSQHASWLVTVDPHLHRYHSLDEIYTIPSRVIQGAPLLAEWLKGQEQLLLVGPDAESDQWVSSIATVSGHPYVVGSKEREGDRQVKITLPDLSSYTGRRAVIVDDVISSGQTILECIAELHAQNFKQIGCVAVHGIFADASDKALMETGLDFLVTTNTIVHESNGVDMGEAIAGAVKDCLGLCSVKEPLC